MAPSAARVARALAVIALVSLTGAVRARACSFSQFNHLLSPEMQAVDHQPPTLPPILEVKITRGHAPQDDGCSGGLTSSCEDLGSIDFTATATDDLTPPAHIGYRFTLVAGRLPENFILPTGAVEAGPNPVVKLVWDDGAFDSQDALDLTVQVVAVDLAGNESAPQTIRLQQGMPSSSGCAFAGRASSSAGFAALAFTALASLAWRGRRSRRPRSG